MKIVDLVAEKGAASVPMHLQIKAGHMLYKAKNKLGMYTKFPEFVEAPVPEAVSYTHLTLPTKRIV